MDTAPHLDQSSQTLLSAGQRAALEDAAVQATHNALSSQFQATQSPVSLITPQEIRFLRTKLANLRLENLRKEQKLQGLKDVFHSMRVTSAPTSPKRVYSCIKDLKEQIQEALEGLEGEKQTEETIAMQRETLYAGVVRGRQAVAKEREREVREVHRRVTRKYAEVRITRFQAEQQAALAASALNTYKLTMEDTLQQYKTARAQQLAVLQRTEQQAEQVTLHISHLNQALKSRKHSETATLQLLTTAVQLGQSRKQQAESCQLRLEQLCATLGRIGE